MTMGEEMGENENEANEEKEKVGTKVALLPKEFVEVAQVV